MLPVSTGVPCWPLAPAGTSSSEQNNVYQTPGPKRSIRTKGSLHMHGLIFVGPIMIELEVINPG
jgi:hypothetical protein